MSTTWKHIEESLDQHPVRKLRLEVILHEIEELWVGQPPAIVIEPEPSSIYNFEADFDLKDYSGRFCRVNTPQVSFYDRLPEQLFHKPVRPTFDDDKFQIIRREEEKQEQEGRQFFLPFDNRLFKYRVAIEKLEQETLTGDNTNLLRQLVARLWAYECQIELLSNFQLIKLVQLLPTIHRVVGNLPLSERHMTEIIGLPIRLLMEQSSLSVSLASPETFFPNVGEMVLAVDSVLWGQSIETTFPCVRVQIGDLFTEFPKPIPASCIIDFLPGGAWRRLVESLLELILPVEVDYVLDLITEVTDSTWLDETVDIAGRLGYTTHI